MEKTSPPPDPPAPPAPDARTGTRGFLDATVERFVREFRADRAQLFLYDEESNTLTLRAAHGYPAFGYLGDLPQTLCEVYPSVSRVPLYRFYILDENGNRPSNLPDTNDDLAEINRIWRQAGMELISSLLMFGVHESDQSVDLPRSSVRAADYEGNVAFPKNGLSNLHRTPSSIVEP